MGGKSRHYHSELREEQAAATRERILDAAHHLLGTTRPVDLAYRDVAREAGVSIRTVYRHFPTPDDLFLGLSDRLLGAILGPEMTGIEDEASGIAALRRQCEMLEQDPALFRVMFAVPTRSRLEEAKTIERVFGARLAAVPDDRRPLAFALLDLFASPYAWDVLHANWGADADAAHRAIGVGLRAVLELLEREPGAFDHDDTFRGETP